MGQQDSIVYRMQWLLQLHMRCIYTYTLEDISFVFTNRCCSSSFGLYYQPYTVPVATCVHVWLATVVCEIPVLASCLPKCRQG